MVTRYYPVFLKLAGKLCVVIGGGRVAERKVRSLLECEARVRVISPELTPRLKDWADEGKFEYKKGSYEHHDLDGAFLVISATNQENVNESVSAECSRRNILVNVVDTPSRANFFVPATVRRGSLSIAVSTGGKSPLMARLIRQDIESLYGPGFGTFIDYLGSIRKQIVKNVNNPAKRQRILSQLVDVESLRLLKEGYLEQAKERVDSVYRSCGD